jgi:hypothetical protein
MRGIRDRSNAGYDRVRLRTSADFCFRLGWGFLDRVSSGQWYDHRVDVCHKFEKEKVAHCRQVMDINWFISLIIMWSASNSSALPFGT